MENRQKKQEPQTPEYIKALTICAWFVWAAYGILIAMKYFNVVRASWTVVLMGVLWIPAIMLAVCAAVYGVLMLIVYTKRMIRRRKTDARIRAQAKTMGIWNFPAALGGRALQLSAWENFRVRKKRKETDAQLRLRCMARELQRKKEDSRRGKQR